MVGIGVTFPFVAFRSFFRGVKTVSFKEVNFKTSPRGHGVSVSSQGINGCCNALVSAASCLANQRGALNELLHFLLKMG